MNDKVKIALIAALAALGVTWIIMHYSPYQTCVRAKQAMISEEVLTEYTPEESLRLAQTQCAGAD
ncbi:MAG TPA: hypothetical protein VN034_07640 [Sphingopyxis sp.]|nr:hypothetical protein [Sphingopyxis sp.]